MNEPQTDVLIVEDEPVVQMAAQRVLNRAGITTDSALDVGSAIAKMRAEAYKLVLCDLKLPGSSGFELIDHARTLTAAPEIVMITGYATLENAMEAFQLGAFDFIPKPFDPRELLGVVRRAIRFRVASGASGTLSPDFLAEEAARHDADTEAKRYLLGRHSWARIDQEGMATLGAAETFAGLLREIETVEFPGGLEHTVQGQTLVRVLSHGGLLHRVWAPLSGQILTTNQQVEAEPQLLDRDPLGAGWLAQIIPSDLERELPLIAHRSIAHGGRNSLP
ncbi:MAG: response regulator [Nitrospirae bacterium]|nr:response regulator [Nitrospirota bacterium]